MSQGAISLTNPAVVQPGQGNPGRGGPLKAVAAAPGLSTTDLRTLLQAGKSLDDVAVEKGLSQTDLVAAIKKGLLSQVRSAADAGRIAEDISTRKGLPPRGPGGPGGLGRGRDAGEVSGVLSGSISSTKSKLLDALSSALGTDTRSLVARLHSETSLSSLVSSQGPDGGTLADILQNGLLFDAKA